MAVTRRIAGLAVALFALTGSLVWSNSEEVRPAVLRVGMIKTLFRGMDDKTMQGMTGFMSDVMTAQAGMPCDVAVMPDGDKIASRIQDGELQIGIMHGIEYAWVKDQYPELQPLVLACNKVVKLRAFVLVREDSAAKTLADLKGKPVAIPKKSLNHVHVYLHKLLTDAKEDPGAYFAPSTLLGNAEGALDAVVDGTGACTVIDGVAWEGYQQRKPGRAAKLRVLTESVDFPTSVIVYKPITTPVELAKRLKDSLQSAHERPISRQMLTLWRLSNFAKVPDDFGALLDNVRKEYPEPVIPVQFVIEPGKTAAVVK